jgi:hypothetical protein
LLVNLLSFFVMPRAKNSFVSGSLNFIQHLLSAFQPLFFGREPLPTPALTRPTTRVSRCPEPPAKNLPCEKLDSAY